jgi:serine/threonine protein kinase
MKEFSINGYRFDVRNVIRGSKTILYKSVEDEVDLEKKTILKMISKRHPEEHSWLMNEIKIQNLLRERDPSGLFNFCVPILFSGVLEDSGLELKSSGPLEFLCYRRYDYELFDFLVTGGILEKISSLPVEENEQLIRFIFLRIVLAVNFLHNNGIAHRDLKLENMLIDPETLCIYLSDFGFAQDTPDSGLIPWDELGSENYVSPDALNCDYGDYYNCIKGDIFSLGVILFIFTFLMFPFKKSIGKNSTYRWIKGKKIEKIVGVTKAQKYSDELIDLIYSLTESIPEKRPTTKDLLNHCWMKGPLPSEYLLKKLFH